MCDGREFRSGSHFSRGTKLDGLVADAVVAIVRQRVIVFVVKDFDRYTRWECFALGGVWAAMGAEGALADFQVSGVADDRELDWCHLPLLVPDALQSF